MNCNFIFHSKRDPRNCYCYLYQSCSVECNHIGQGHNFLILLLENPFQTLSKVFTFQWFPIDLVKDRSYFKFLVAAWEPIRWPLLVSFVKYIFLSTLTFFFLTLFCPTIIPFSIVWSTLRLPKSFSLPFPWFILSYPTLCWPNLSN